MRGHAAPVAIAGFLFAAGTAALLHSQAIASVRDGAYTLEQSMRGDQAYRADCASCHGSTLEGSGQAPPLADAEFARNWDGLPLGDLFERIQRTMPADRPGEMSRTRTADIVAFLLKANKLPDGSRELPSAPDALNAIRFEAAPSGK
jgi:mono/diheme cytochrome c family protein